jgi:anti-sigma regulatory factor (Ser/Thr protein kinase)
MSTTRTWPVALVIEALAAVEGDIDGFLGANHIDAHAAGVALLVVEEIVRNLIQHTPPYESDETADVTVALSPTEVTVVVEDRRQPFAPEEAPGLDVGAPLEARRAGGMGVHLVRNLADSIAYERVGDRNRLTVTVRRT